jgi:hypothetical protein
VKHATHCKFCKKPISVAVADDYAEHGDVFKLLPLACCNPCADIRIEKRRLERKVQIVARCLELSGPDKTDKLRSDCRSKLTKLTQDYAKLIARWNGMQGMSWDEEVVNMIVEKPDSWATLLGQLWKMFRHYNETRTL